MSRGLPESGVRKEQTMKRVVFLLALLAGLPLAACNTVAGFGRDLQNAGQAIEKKSQSGEQPAGPPANPPAGQQ